MRAAVTSLAYASAAPVPYRAPSGRGASALGLRAVLTAYPRVIRTRQYSSGNSLTFEGKVEKEFANQILSITFDKEKTKRVFQKLVGVLIAEKIKRVEITYGFAWGNEIYESVWKPISVHPGRIEEMVEKEARKGTGEIGSDDFYIELPEKKIRLQICHENDLHIEYESEDNLVNKLKSILAPEEWAWKKEKGDKDWTELITRQGN